MLLLIYVFGMTLKYDKSFIPARAIRLSRGDELGVACQFIFIKTNRNETIKTWPKAQVPTQLLIYSLRCKSVWDKPFKFQLPGYRASRHTIKILPR